MTRLLSTTLPPEVLPYQSRVIEERIQLAVKVNSLEAFVLAEGFPLLPAPEQELMSEQLEHMAMYLGVLDERVALMTKAERYTCHSEVLARPMTRGTYNTLRGWDLPDDEDGSDEGFLLENLDGGKANHASFAGYINWMPADMFNRSYSKKVT